jgi:hypothetical protein
VETNLNGLKKHVFFEMLNLAGRVFILVRHSENVVLGNRGFSDEEKEKGIALVFNSRMNFLWDEYGITVTLVFGTSPQKCFIPVDDIISVYSPELNAQFVASPQTAAGGRLQAVKKESPKKIRKGIAAAPSSAKDPDKTSAKASDNVIKIDFSKKKKKEKDDGQ